MEKRIKASRIEYVPTPTSTANRDRMVSHAIDHRVAVPSFSSIEGGSDYSASKIVVYMMAGFFILLIIVGMFGDGDSKPKHDLNGGYMDVEVITQKIDRGQKLTPAEQKRLNDVLFDPRWDGDK